MIQARQLMVPLPHAATWMIRAAHTGRDISRMSRATSNLLAAAAAAVAVVQDTYRGRLGHVRWGERSQARGCQRKEGRQAQGRADQNIRSRP